MANLKIQHSCTDERTPKKLIQTSICKYFEGYKCISIVHGQETPKGKGRAKRKVTTSMSKKRTESTSFSSGSQMESAFKNADVPRKRKLEYPLFSESEDSDSENDQSVYNISHKSYSSNNQEKTSVLFKKSLSQVKKSKKPLGIAKCLSSTNEESSKTYKIDKLECPSTSRLSYNEGYSKSVELNSLEFPSTSYGVVSSSEFSKSLTSKKLDGLMTTPKRVEIISDVVVSPPKKPPSFSNGGVSCSELSKSPTENAQLDSSMITPIKAPILNNVLKTPSKQSPKKNNLCKQSVMKKEEQKLNYTTLHVMKQFFENVLKTNHLKYLLNDTDRIILCNLFNLDDKNHKYVCIKLFMWKQGWYNIFKFVERTGLKMEDSEVIRLYNVLKDNNFVDTNYLDQDLFTLLNLLSLKEVKEIQRSFKFNYPETRKDLIIAKLLKNCQTQATLTYKKSTEQVLRARVHEKLGFCVKLSDKLSKALKYIYVLNTFANPNFLRIQDYFRDTNHVFPDYIVEDLQIFGKEEFIKYAQALELKQDMVNAIEKNKRATVFILCQTAFTALKENSCGEENPLTMHGIGHLERFTAQFQYVSILTSGSKLLKASHYKEVKDWLEFLISQKYCSDKRGHWFCLLSLIYGTYLKDYEAANKLIISAFENEKDHLSEVQLHELAQRGKVLNKKTYKLPTLFHDKIAALSPPSCDRNWPTEYTDSKAIRSNESGQKRRYIQELENGNKYYLTVEQVALEHYKKKDFPDGLHCEGSVICVSFCLLFWDILYNHYVKGAFISNMQNAPLDMFTKYFYLNREDLIKERLYNIKSGLSDQELKCMITKNWECHSHKTSLCLMEDIICNPEHLYQIIECIGRPVLAKILERLVKNYKIYRSGFPDLIVWNHKTKKAKFVEVKGENDQLSVKQKLWLQYLMDIGADVELCNVHSKGSKQKEVKKN